ncbi:hypothetical protein KP77_26260 [Jeotgalibacillus alimentarius]|uniref:Uncharacterized protein n=1 Tax=Jeotgalibacillus alimentarius TaxID=135826 RepID=A0A0C2RXP5_9BACL|nr:hypothetical protein KP77_26260 [Jeotgalibacillus alimentarius]
MRPRSAKREEAHRRSRGKRPPAAEISGLSIESKLSRKII